MPEAPRYMSRPLLRLVLIFSTLMLGRGFDIRRHLATKTRYAFKSAIPHAPSLYAHPDPAGFEPLHVWLLSRHGSRWPTPSRMAQINSLDKLFKDASNAEQHPWVRGWVSPVKELHAMGGDLHAIGEDEMWALARRLRSRFPSLASAPYYPKRHNIVSTQVPRAAASASAFASGFFPSVSPAADESHAHIRAALLAMRSISAARSASTLGRADVRIAESLAAAERATNTLSGSLDPAVRAALADPTLDFGSLTEEEAEVLRVLTHHTATAGGTRPQAIAISMAPKRQDPLLRFFDMCPAYEAQEEYTEEWLAGWMARKWAALAPRLGARLGLKRDVQPCEVQGLWQLCLLEAGLHNDTSKACSLFTPAEVTLLEWMDDVGLYENHGYGASINYDIASPLLADLLQTLKDVAAEEQPVLKTRLLFAHCETLVPLASLMGLFQDQLTISKHNANGVCGVEQASQGGEGRLLEHVDDELMQAVGDLGLGWAQEAAGDRSKASAACYKAKAVSGTPPPPNWKPAVPLNDQRMWRGARVGPYGANMAVVLYRARDGNRSSSHLVRLVYNEQVVRVPGSSGPGLDCSLEELVQLYGNLGDPAVMKRVCAGGSPSAAPAG